MCNDFKGLGLTRSTPISSSSRRIIFHDACARLVHRKIGELANALLLHIFSLLSHKREIG
jgi:hypothetical protein